MNNKKIGEILLIVILSVIIIVALAFAYYDITTIYNANVNVTLNSPETSSVEIIGDTSRNITVNSLSMFKSSEDVEAYNKTNGFLLKFANDSSTVRTCKYDYVWTWDEDSDNYTALADNEFTIITPDGEVSVPNYDAENLSTTIASGSISSQNLSYKLATYQIVFRNLSDVDQSSRLNASYKGKLSIELTSCKNVDSSFTEDTTVNLNDTIEALSVPTTSSSDDENKIIDYDDYDIRYVGTNPNNYIYFNCSDYTNQSSESCGLYRIIGLFDSRSTGVSNTKLVKLINTTYINSSLKFDSKNNTTGSNYWYDSQLMMLLNPSSSLSSNYSISGDNVVNSDGTVVYKSMGSYYNGSTSGYDIQSVTTGSTSYNGNSIDLTNVSLKNDTTRNMIKEVSILDVATGATNTLDSIYTYERYLGDNTWNGKILIPYYSDYLLAGLNTTGNWITSIYESYSDTTKGIAALGSGVAKIAGSSSSISSDPTDNYFVNDSFYLNENVQLVGGSGTIDDPYQVNMN